MFRKYIVKGRLHKILTKFHKSNSKINEENDPEQLKVFQTKSNWIDVRVVLDVSKLFPWNLE